MGECGDAGNCAGVKPGVGKGRGLEFAIPGDVAEAVVRTWAKSKSIMVARRQVNERRLLAGPGDAVGIDSETASLDEAWELGHGDHAAAGGEFVDDAIREIAGET